MNEEQVPEGAVEVVAAEFDAHDVTGQVYGPDELARIACGALHERGWLHDPAEVTALRQRNEQQYRELNDYDAKYGLALRRAQELAVEVAALRARLKAADQLADSLVGVELPAKVAGALLVYSTVSAPR